MMSLDTKLQELEEKGTPIRVGLIGAGFAGRGFALQVLTAVPGMQLVAISNRTLSFAKQAYTDAGVNEVYQAKTKNQFETYTKAHKAIITDNPFQITRSPFVDVIVEATGTIEFASRVVMDAIEHKKHVVLINAELDTTLGPILFQKAQKAGVVYTQADGDQPAVIMNLIREVRLMGFTPVLAGNIKSLLDPRRTPETQKAFAEAHFQRPQMITSFADGTKISMEMATVANATGFKVGQRGMYGPACSNVNEASNLFDHKQLMNGGLIDYILGAEPSFGVFVLAYGNNPIRQRYMQVYKMGDGPIYNFYRPYHLSPLEAPLSVARAVIAKDAALAPTSGPVCDVVTIAKRDLKKGEILDGIGGFTCYGTIDNHETAKQENLLPMGLSEGCQLKRDLAIDTPITWSDVELPPGYLSHELALEQEKYFSKRK